MYPSRGVKVRFAVLQQGCSRQVQKEKKGKPCGLLVVKRKKRNLSSRMGGSGRRRKGEGKQKLTRHATDVRRGLAIGVLEEVII
jgi:hypothetical protein